jgi:hypothetical protein
MALLVVVFPGEITKDDFGCLFGDTFDWLGEPVIFASALNALKFSNQNIMSATFSATPLIIFILCLIAALVIWFASDQFRDQLMGDSHRLVRGLALRYFTGMIIIFSVLAIVGLFSLWSFVSNTVEVMRGPPPPTATATITPTATRDPLATLAPSPTATESGPLPTVTPAADIPPPDPVFDDLSFATVGGTSGVGVNLRDAPGLESNVIAIVPEGTTVTLRGEPEFVDGLNWWPVVGQNGEQGWLVELFLVFE